jgi:hypothetical protein
MCSEYRHHPSEYNGDDHLKEREFFTSTSYKVDVHNSNITRIWTFVVESYVIRS